MPAAAIIVTSPKPVTRETSRQRRFEAVAARKLAVTPVRHEKGRPTKRDRRQLRRFRIGE